MPTQETHTGAVIERRTIQPARSILRLGRMEVRVPRAYRVQRVGSGSKLVGDDVTAKAGDMIASDEPISFWVVNRGPFELFLPLEDVIRDGAGHGWNLHLDVDLSVADAARLLVEDVMVLVDEHRPLTSDRLGHWLQERLPTRMKHRLDGESDAALRARHGRPIEAWKAELNDLLSPWGLSAVLKTRPGWVSPSAEAVELRRKAEEARVAAEKSAAEASRVDEERRKNEAAQKFILEQLSAARREKNEARAAQAAEEARKQTQRAMAEAEALKARERNARLAAERDEAEHRLRQADYERLIRQKELEQAELAADIELVSVRKEQKAEAEARMKAAERAVAGIREEIGAVAAEVAQLLTRAAALGAGAEELSRAVRSLNVLVQQGDHRTIERFNQLDGQMQVLFQRMDRSIDGGLDERRAMVGRLEEFFTEWGRMDERIQRHLQPVLGEVQNLGQNLKAQFAEVGDLIGESFEHLSGKLDLTHGEVLEQRAKLQEIVDLLRRLKLDPRAATEVLDGRAILRKYITKPTGVSGFRLRKSNLTQRDVGVLTRDYSGKRKGQPVQGPRITGVNMDCVRVGDPVDLAIQSPIQGYLTLINIGTSGRYWLISPHRYSGHPVRLDPGWTYEIPGPELLPKERLWDNGFESVGADAHLGVEGFVAFVTPKPLLNHDDSRLLPHELFWEVPDSLLAEMDAAFAAMPDDQKAVGTLQYQIIPR